MLGRTINAERGHAVLYAVLIVPFAFLLTTIAVDISAWNATRDKLQQEADRLAFQGLGGLPNMAEVQSRVQQAAQSLISAGVDVEVFVPSAPVRSSVEVTLTSKYQPRFGLFSTAALGNAFKIQRRGTAQLVPGDFVLIVADGATLRPPLVAQPPTSARPYSFPAWGAELDWPAAAYFNTVSAASVSIPNELSWDWWKDWENPDFNRWATQSCFNPVLSPLKFAAIGISEALLSYGVNRIGFMFTPGERSAQGFHVIRHVHGEDDDPALYQGQVGGFPESGRVAAGWSDYLELEQFLGDKACILFSDPFANISDRYAFTDDADSCNARAEPVLERNNSHIHRLTQTFSRCYDHSGVTLREAIYWNAAKLPLPTFSARPNIIASLRQAWSELTDDRTLSVEKRKRGNLAHNSLRQILVLSDSLPNANDAELQQLLDNFQSRHIQVTVAAFMHEGLNAAAAQDLRNNFSGWQNLSLTYPKVLRTVLAEDPNALQTQIVPQFLSSALHFALRT